MPLRIVTTDGREVVAPCTREQFDQLLFRFDPDTPRHQCPYCIDVLSAGEGVVHCSDCKLAIALKKVEDNLTWRNCIVYIPIASRACEAVVSKVDKETLREMLAWLRDAYFEEEETDDSG